MPKHWSDQQLDLLQTNWREPGLSLSQIAAAINAQTGARFSRNAIAGQAKRLGLPLRRQPNRNNKGPRPASARPTTRIVAVNLRRRKARAPARPVIGAPLESEPADAPAHLGLSLLDLGPGTCRYPRGVERFTFCGQPTERDRPYCGFHTRLCYAPKDRNLDRNTDRSLVSSERRAA